MEGTGMQFSSEDQHNALDVRTASYGSVVVELNEWAHDEAFLVGRHRLTLGQSIHLRDFLNRHIDGLALATTGSTAKRSSDDPAQLASEEVVEQ